MADSASVWKGARQSRRTFQRPPQWHGWQIKNDKSWDLLEGFQQKLCDMWLLWYCFTIIGTLLWIKLVQQPRLNYHKCVHCSSKCAEEHSHGTVSSFIESDKKYLAPKCVSQEKEKKKPLGSISVCEMKDFKDYQTPRIVWCTFTLNGQIRMCV